MESLQTATVNTESRMERLVQPGRECQRHLVAILADFDMEMSGGRLRFLCRQVVDRHSEWKAAQQRLQNPCNLAMWSVLVGSAVKQAQREMEEGVLDIQQKMRWYVEKQWPLDSEEVQIEMQRKKDCAATFHKLKYFASWSHFFHGRELEQIVGATVPEKMRNAAQLEQARLQTLPLFRVQHNDARTYADHPPPSYLKKGVVLDPIFLDFSFGFLACQRIFCGRNRPHLRPDSKSP